MTDITYRTFNDTLNALIKYLIRFHWDLQCNDIHFHWILYWRSINIIDDKSSVQYSWDHIHYCDIIWMKNESDICVIGKKRLFYSIAKII